MSAATNVCPHCTQAVFAQHTGGTAKIGRTPMVLHKSGEIEVNCPHCRAPVIVGRLESVAMRKAVPRLVIRQRNT